jgi:hypothetical protein
MRLQSGRRSYVPMERRSRKICWGREIRDRQSLVRLQLTSLKSARPKRALTGPAQVPMV